MRKIWAICRKEITVTFSSPVGYIAGAVFLAVSGVFFTLIVSSTREASLRHLFYNMAVMMLLVAPMITMRLFSEEKKMGTFELLMTMPVRLPELVLGKFLGASILVLAIVGLTMQFPVFLMSFGNPDLGPLFTGYLGFILMALALTSIGLFVSSLTDSMFVSGIVSFGIMLLLWIISWAGDMVGGIPGDFIRATSLIDRLESFVKGILDTGDIVYYLSVIGISLFLTVRALDWRRW